MDNPWSRKAWNLTEQGRILSGNPALARRLQTQAAGEPEPPEAVRERYVYRKIGPSSLPPPTLLDVRLFGAKGNGAADDSGAIAGAMQQAASMFPVGTVYLPTGQYRVTQPMPLMTTAVSLRGDGPWQSVVQVDPALSGDLFSWSEVWAKAGEGTNTLTLSAMTPGVSVRDLTIYGNRATTNTQNAIMFYDRADEVFVDNVDILYMNGRAVGSGITKNQPQAYMRESRLRGVRAFWCGNATATLPAVEFNSAGTGDATDEVDVQSLSIFAPFWTGLHIRNGNTSSGLNDMRFSRLRVEGLQNGTTAADLVQVGDATLTGVVNNIDFEQAQLLDPYTSFAAIRFTAPAAASQPYQCRFQGGIGGGIPNGKGVVVTAGRSLRFLLRQVHTTDTNITVGPTPLTGTNLFFDGYGEDSSWTTSIDASATANVISPSRTTGV